MNRAAKLLAVAAALVGLSPCASAQSVSTDPVGFVTLITLSNSDTIFSTPLARPEVFRGLVGAVGSSTVTASGTPGWTADAFAYAAGVQSNTYYLRFRTGAKAGSYFTITANTATALTLDLAGDLLTGVTAGDEFAVVPYWTLGTVFPPGAAGTAFEASSAVARKTEILLPDSNALGINAAAAAKFYFQGSTWRKSGFSPASTSFNDAVLPPDSYVIVRNQAFTGTVTVLGGVVTAKQSSPLNSYLAAKQDNYVALGFPMDVTLDSSGLASVFVASSGVVRNDELLVFNNNAPGQNKSPSAIYYYQGGIWRKAGAVPATTNFGGDVIKAGSGFIVRKAKNASEPAKTVDWVFNPAPSS